MTEQMEHTQLIGRNQERKINEARESHGLVEMVFGRNSFPHTLACNYNISYYKL